MAPLINGLRPTRSPASLSLMSNDSVYARLVGKTIKKLVTPSDTFSRTTKNDDKIEDCSTSSISSWSCLTLRLLEAFSI